MTITINRSQSIKIKLTAILIFFLIAIGASIFFVKNYSSYSEIKNTAASDACPPGGALLPDNLGCHYARPGQIAYGVDGVNTQQAIIGDAACDPGVNGEKAFRVETSRENVCNYTHDQVCVQAGWNNTAANCPLSADWECCSPMWHDGRTPKKYIALPNGKLVLEKDFYTGIGIDGRLEEASCSKLVGWAGTKSDFAVPVEVFFTIGGPLGDSNAVIFNPQNPALVAADDREPATCDFLDNKSDGMVEECRFCAGTVCNHGFTIDLTQFTDSPIFNGKADNKIYAYGYYGENQEVGILRDSATATVDYLTIPGNCGSTGVSSSGTSKYSTLPTGVKSDGSNVGNTGNNGGSNGDGTGTPVSGICRDKSCSASIDYDKNHIIDISDFNSFLQYYKECTTAQVKTSQACKYIDLNEDDRPENIISDFGVFKSIYLDSIA